MGRMSDLAIEHQERLDDVVCERDEFHGAIKRAIQELSIFHGIPELDSLRESLEATIKATKGT